MVRSSVTESTRTKGAIPIESLFDPDYPQRFAAFAADHWSAIAALCLSALLLYWFRNRLAGSDRAQSIVKWTLLTALLLPEAALHIWYGVKGVWNPATSLPLELCSLTLFLSAALLITGADKLYPLVYFAGIGGAMQAILTPSLDYSFPHFRFFHFFIIHSAIILTALYMTWVRKYRPTWRSIGWTMLFLNGAALAVGLINMALGSNYMFLMRKPETSSLLDLLGPHPYYILAEELIVLMLFVVMYALFFALPSRVARYRKRAAPKAGSSSSID
ncbi:TIGR02206 family membrane protein [Paenibacillus campinasensis]|uniref:TIGR02206 family membrane protein n=1 Tax=Paenibacillus campinasensis TaxID=66347 RepID=A0ABW9SZ30_9BACL|nr:TIGR02206 family membrane protein [Paenibacillus campinasensis]MUG66273.1 TIGR02206 family membrane protein [Paenibacillus campinasensis]